MNLINIISIISIFGTAGLTMTLVIILSIFNGFDNIIRSMFNSFDPDLKISVIEGKTFHLNSQQQTQIKNIEGVVHFVEVLEETALFQYNDKQYIAKIKGVSNNFSESNKITEHISDGEFSLGKAKMPMAIVGFDVATFLSLNVNFAASLKIWVPRRQQKVTFNVDQAFNTMNIMPSGIFSIQQEYDAQYVIVPILFARKLLEYDNEVSYIELNLTDKANVRKIQKQIQSFLGEQFEVKDRYQQQELLYKIMKSEKWAIFAMLSFVILIVSFAIIGSLMMLIIDKKDDIETLKNMGASKKTIRNIFLLEGWMISLIGGILGVVSGTLISWLQQEFGFIRFPNNGAFIISAYPVDIQIFDIFIVFAIVALIGFTAAWYPVRYTSAKYLK